MDSRIKEAASRLKRTVIGKKSRHAYHNQANEEASVLEQILEFQDQVNPIYQADQPPVAQAPADQWDGCPPPDYKPLPLLPVKSPKKKEPSSQSEDGGSGRLFFRTEEGSVLLPSVNYLR